MPKRRCNGLMNKKRSPKEKEGIQVKVDGTGTPYWAGFYWELTEPGKKNPPTAVLSRDMNAPAWELSALREREKPKVMKRLGLTADVSDKTISKLSREWLEDEVHPDNGKNSLKNLEGLQAHDTLLYRGVRGSSDRAVFLRTRKAVQEVAEG